MENNVLKEQEIMVGHIVKMVADKGYGFIRIDNTGKSIFFHAKNVVAPRFEELNIGDKVEFSTNETEKGLKAINVAGIS